MPADNGLKLETTVAFPPALGPLCPADTTMDVTSKTISVRLLEPKLKYELCSGNFRFYVQQLFNGPTGSHRVTVPCDGEFRV